MVFGRSDLAALRGCHTLNVCLFVMLHDIHTGMEKDTTSSFTSQYVTRQLSLTLGLKAHTSPHCVAGFFKSLH
jgi:hypothetical protein